MKNLKISLKLIIGFGIILVLTVIIAVLGIRGVNSVADRVDKADDVNRIVKYQLELQQHAKDYALTKDKIYLENGDKLLETIVKQANDTKGKFKDKYNKDEMDEIIRNLYEFKDAVYIYADAQDAKDIEMGKMRTDARNALNEFEAISSDQLLQLDKYIKSGSTNSAFLNDKISKAFDAEKLITFFYK